MEINMKDLGLSVIVLIVVFSLLSFLFPVNSIETCTGNCLGGGITNCSCTVSQPEPFPYFFILRIMLPILLGSSYYVFRNNMNIQGFLTLLIILFMALVVTYLLFYTIFPGPIQLSS